MIKTRTSKWYEVKVATERMTDDGNVKEVKEVYCVDALSFAEAESKIIAYMEDFAIQGVDVKEEKIAKFKEVVMDDAGVKEHWWKVKVVLIFFDEMMEKEKKAPMLYLVNADSNDEAFRMITKVMDGGMTEYQILDVTKTPIVELIEHVVK